MANLYRNYEEYLTPETEIQNRIRCAQKNLQDQNIDAAWLTNRVSILYFTGSAQTGSVIIPKDDEPVFFVKKYYPRALEESKRVLVKNLKSFSEIIRFIQKKPIHRLGLELDVMPALTAMRLAKEVGLTNLFDISADLRMQRAVKSEWELGFIKEAAKILDSTFEMIPEWLYPGITEIELANKIDHFIKHNGHQGSLPMRGERSAAQWGAILFGDSAAIRGPFDGPANGKGLYPAFPAGPSCRPLRREMPVYIDFVVGINGYMADATRIFCVGRIPERLQEIHDSCCEIQNHLIREMESCRSVESLYGGVQNMVRNWNLEDLFMGRPDDQPSFIGHGIGLEINEFPIISNRVTQIIPDQTVLAIEPKCILPGFGAVGIENTWYISDKGCEKLLKTPDHIKIV